MPVGEFVGLTVSVQTFHSINTFQIAHFNCMGGVLSAICNQRFEKIPGNFKPGGTRLDAGHKPQIRDCPGVTGRSIPDQTIPPYYADNDLGLYKMTLTRDNRLQTSGVYSGLDNFISPRTCYTPIQILDLLNITDNLNPNLRVTVRANPNPTLALTLYSGLDGFITREYNLDGVYSGLLHCETQCSWQF